MNTHDDDQMKRLLKQTLPPTADAEPGRDLWPAMLRKMHEPATTQRFNWVWFDWALACGLMVFAVLAPVSIPMLLYYL